MKAMYVNYGDGIVVPDEDAVAKEALVFMLVSFRGHWKYTVGYILDDTVNAEDLHCLLSRLLDLCARNAIKVKCITCDGTSVNFGAMKLFGCKLGKNIYEIKDSFTHEGFGYKLYSTPDPPHMLKLVRNALGELGVFVDYKGRKKNGSSSRYSSKCRRKKVLRLFANKLSNCHTLAVLI